MGRPCEKARIGWKVWSCGDNASEMDYEVTASKTDESVLFGVVRRKILVTERNSTDFDNFVEFGKYLGNSG